MILFFIKLGVSIKRIDLTGKKFGNLIVLGYSHSHVQPSGQKRAVWDVLCNCGVKKKMSTSNLISKNSISCGCYAKNIRALGINRLKPGEASFNYKYRTTQWSAKNRKIRFSLTKEQFREIITKNCYYCSAQPVERYVNKCVNGQFKSNGIDRIDNNLGYGFSNCVPCCNICNFMKLNLTYADFLNHIKRIYNHVIDKIQI